MKTSHRKIWEENSGKSIPDNWHVHHLDGDNSNDHPYNLICVSPEIHAEIHEALYKRYGDIKDLHAANMLKGRWQNRQEIHARISESLTGRVLSDETKQKMSEAKLGSKQSISHILNAAATKKKKILNTESGEVYFGVKQAANDWGINPATLTAWLNGGRPNKSPLIYVTQIG